MHSIKAIALIFASLLASSLAELIYIDPHTGIKSTKGPTILQILSEGTTNTLSFFYKGAQPKRAFSSTGALFTHRSIIMTRYENYFNYTVPYELRNDVGSEQFVFSVAEQSGSIANITGTFIIAGFVVKKGPLVVSGESGSGIQVGQNGTYSYDVKAIGLDGRPFNLGGTKIEFAETTGPYMKEVWSASVNETTFGITIEEYRVGSGSFRVIFENRDIEVDGENFETLLYVKQDTKPAPPCVVMGGQYKMSPSGSVLIPMYNLMSPPQPQPIKSVVMEIGGRKYDYTTGVSKFELPDQTVVFRPENVGDASIMCNGKPAKISGGTAVTITGTPPTQPNKPLATDFSLTLPRKIGNDRFSALITLKNSDPTLLTMDEALKIVSNMCQTINGQGCRWESIQRGSAIIHAVGHVPQGDKSSVNELNNCYSTCRCQHELGYSCDDLSVGHLKTEPFEVDQIQGRSITKKHGMPVWAIMVIAMLGAFAIIILVLVALWVVYRVSSCGQVDKELDAEEAYMTQKDEMRLK